MGLVTWFPKRRSVRNRILRFSLPLCLFLVVFSFPIGLADTVKKAIGAILLDILSGKGKRPRLFYSVMRLSERFDLWINLNGAMEKLERGETDEGLFGTTEAGSDSLLGKIQELMQKGDKSSVKGDSGPTEPDV